MAERVTIIAEAGVNHNGSLDLAKKLVDVAAEAGADYVKFQTFKAEKLVSKAAKKASYQQTNDPSADDSQFAMLKRLELSEQAHRELIDYCSQKEIRFLSTGFDEDAIDFLCDLGIDLFKIPSGEITNLPYIRKIASKKQNVILSTGMSTMEEIGDAIRVLTDSGIDRDRITVLHCNTEYPTPFSDVNLRAMQTIRDHFDVKVGYSDHTLGIEVPVAAVALGATVIEKHFTLDRTMPGPDHKASLEPTELIDMVKSIRNIEMALGSSVKTPSASEMKNIVVARKSIHVKSDIAAGETLTIDKLVMKRPGDGISPMELDAIVGRRAKQDLAANTQLRLEHLE